MPTSNSTNQGLDRDALLRVVEPIVHAHGAELVDLEFRPERGGWVLRLYVEKEGASEKNLSTRDAAVDLDLCAGISRDLSPALDVADLVPHAYQLEISSPGVERPLRTEKDFARFRGQRAKIKLREPVDGRRVVVGRLAGAGEGKVRIDDSGRVLEVPLSSVDSARLVFEFGAPRPPRSPGTSQRRGALAKRH